MGLAEDLKDYDNVEDFEDECDDCCGCGGCGKEDDLENKGISVKLNVSLNPDDLEDILDTVDYLEEKLSNIKVKFSL